MSEAAYTDSTLDTERELPGGRRTVLASDWSKPPHVGLSLARTRAGTRVNELDNLQGGERQRQKLEEPGTRKN